MTTAAPAAQATATRKCNGTVNDEIVIHAINAAEFWSEQLHDVPFLHIIYTYIYVYIGCSNWFESHGDVVLDKYA